MHFFPVQKSREFCIFLANTPVGHFCVAGTQCVLLNVRIPISMWCPAGAFALRAGVSSTWASMLKVNKEHSTSEQRLCSPVSCLPAVANNRCLGKNYKLSAAKAWLFHWCTVWVSRSWVSKDFLSSTSSLYHINCYQWKYPPWIHF